jgi:hypothetical protein
MMSAYTWISLQLDAGVAAVDKQKHQVVSGSATNGDVVFGFTAAKPMSLNLVDSTLAVIRQNMIGRGSK